MWNGENIPVDLSNPKHVWSINKSCENKSEFITYHQKVAAAFKEDCENFLLLYETRKDLTFKAFADVWQQCSFSLVFVGQEFVEELSVFAESCYFIIKKYLIFSQNVYIQTGAFYLLYGIYAKQPSKEVVKIRLTREEYFALLKLVEDVRCKDVLDLLYIFRELKFNEAFLLVATPRSLGLEAKLAWPERKMKNDIFHNLPEESPAKKLENLLFLDGPYNLSSLDKVCRDYDKALQEYVQSTSLKSIAIHSESNAVENIEDLFNELKKNLPGQWTPTKEELENKATAEKRKALKEKAYQTANIFKK